jgi:hypothetical protein
MVTNEGKKPITEEKLARGDCFRAQVVFERRDKIIFAITHETLSECEPWLAPRLRDRFAKETIGEYIRFCRMKKKDPKFKALLSADLESRFPDTVLRAEAIAILKEEGILD